MKPAHFHTVPRPTAPARISTSLLALALLCLGACNHEPVKQEKIVHQGVPHLLLASGSGAVSGTETHGGDVVRTRLRNIFDALTMPSSELDQHYVTNGYLEWRLRNVREMERVMWNGIILNYEAIRNPEIKGVIEVMIRGDILKEIDDSPLVLKVFPPEYPEEYAGFDFGPDPYGNCLDEHQQAVPAAVKLNDRGGPLCLDLKLLAQTTQTISELLGVLTHERAHKYGYDHKQARRLQQYIVNNAMIFYTAGKRIEELQVDAHEVAYVPRSAGPILLLAAKKDLRAVFFHTLGIQAHLGSTLEQFDGRLRIRVLTSVRVPQEGERYTVAIAKFEAPDIYDFLSNELAGPTQSLDFGKLIPANELQAGDYIVVEGPSELIVQPRDTSRYSLYPLREGEPGGRKKTVVLFF